jgi:RNA polymerase sigma-70 factor (ECF subfamily)
VVCREGDRFRSRIPVRIYPDDRKVRRVRVLITAAVHHRGMPSGSETVDTEGLRGAYLAYGGELLGYARRFLGDPQLAEEAVQETFARAWRSRASFNHELGAIRGWLFAIERRVLVDLARQRSARPTQPIEHDPVATGDEIERAMMGWQVEEALRRLRPDHRHVLVKTYFGQCSGQELARELGIPEGTVRSRLFYALRSLRLTMDEMGWEW